MKIDTAMIKDGIVIGLSITEKAGLETLEAALISCGDCDHLIPVDSNVHVGDTYDEEKSIFLRDGVRIYPEKTVSEEIAELKDQIGEIQDAMIEIADIVTMSDGGEGGGTDG